MIQLIKKYPLTLLIIAAILFLSLFNPPETNFKPIPNIDKLVHLCMYGGLELVISFEYLRKHNTLNWIKIILLGIIAPVLFGGIMELAQMYFTQNRSGDWIDFVADVIGILLGGLVGLYIIRPLVWRKK